MSANAASLYLKHSFFSNPHGLSDKVFFSKLIKKKKNK